MLTNFAAAGIMMCDNMYLNESNAAKEKQHHYYFDWFYSRDCLNQISKLWMPAAAALSFVDFYLEEVADSLSPKSCLV